MTYGELAITWLKRILLALLLISVIGMAVCSISKARESINRTDALIARCDYWAERGHR